MGLSPIRCFTPPFTVYLRLQHQPRRRPRRPTAGHAGPAWVSNRSIAYHTTAVSAIELSAGLSALLSYPYVYPAGP